MKRILNKKPEGVLSQRESYVLNCIVEAYVCSASPVGSRYLCKKYSMDFGPATIRNIMNDLEEMGFLCQPHVSAGRVPTDLAYRFYVDSLMSTRRLGKRERRVVDDSLGVHSADVKEILLVASQVLGRISAQLGVVLEPSFNRGVFQKMDLVRISPSRLMAVISIKSGLVKTIMMEIESSVPEDMLHQTVFLVNERLSGLSLREVKETIDQRLTDVTVSGNSVIQLILDSTEKLFSFDQKEDVHLGGTSNIVSNPEFAQSEDVARMLGLIENKNSLVNKFVREEDAHLSILIGEENKEDLFRACSVVMAPYSVGNIGGSLGVIGPTRMEYSKIISLVGYVGRALTRHLSEIRG